MGQADRRGSKESLPAIWKRRSLTKAWIVLLPVLAWSIPWGETQGGRAIEGAQGDLQWSIEQVLRSPFPGEMVADRAGQRLAWVFNAEGKRNIWLAEEGGSRTRQLTRFDSDSGQEISSIQFSHDGAWIVFVRGGSENSAREIPNPTSDPAGAVQAILAVEVATGRVVV
ncbi:MAG: hypothetical protein ACO394_05235, partial [Blastocatellia bacterium]